MRFEYPQSRPMMPDREVSGTGGKIEDEEIPENRGEARRRKREEKLARMREQIAEARKKAQGLVDRHKFDFELFAESAAPRFVVSDRFCMLFETREVHMDARWFLEKGCSDGQIVWANYHELAHFWDFVEDHKSVLGKFADCRRQAETTGSALANKFKEKLGAEHPDLVEEYEKRQLIDKNRPDRGESNRFEDMAYSIHHEFWNIVDDIYVNSLVAKRKPSYAEGGRQYDEVRRLYREKLFKESDFTDLPRHKQFMYALLRGEMLPGEEVQVSAEVNDALLRTHRVFGKECSAREIVKEVVLAKNTRGTTAGTRYAILERTLEPIFLELLARDIEEWDPQTPQEQTESGEEGGENDSEGDGDPQEGEGEGNGGEGNENKDGGGDGESEESGEFEGDGESEEGEGGQKKGQPKESPEDGGEDSSEGEPKSGGASRAENLDKAFNPGSQRGGGKNGDGGEDGEPYDGPGIPSPLEFPEGVPEDIDDRIGDMKRGRETWREGHVAKPKPKESTKAREVRQQATRNAEFCRKYEVKVADLQRFREVEATIRPYLADLEKLWRRIIYGQSREHVVESVGHYREGEELDMDEAIREFPSMVSGDAENVRVMRRSETVREIVRRPERICVRLLGDCSGSMDAPKEYEEGADAGFREATFQYPDGRTRAVKIAVDGSGNFIYERRDVLEQAFVLLMISLRQFQTYLNMARGRTRSNLIVDTEAWAFGDRAEKIKAFRGKSGEYEREYADMIRAFARLRNDFGGTRDDKPLAEINASVLPEEIAHIRSRKTLELVFEITDGGTNDDGVAAAKEALANLDRKGVIVRAFQIGTTDASERATFQHVWNRDVSGKELSDPRGNIVGAKIQNLLPALTEALKEHLSRVEL